MNRWWVLALLVAAASAGCTAQPAAQRPSVGTALPSVSTALPSLRSSPGPVTPTQATAMPPSHTPPARSNPSRAPAVSAQARAAGLVDIRTAVPDAILDLRYATSNNFVGVPLYPTGARCLVHRSMAPGLTVAADRLRRAGYLLVFWDCYRPHPVQVRMFQLVPDPKWVARPGPYARSHEAGRSVDVTLAYASRNHTCAAGQRVQGHCMVQMGTGFDDFTARAHAFAVGGVSPQARSNRERLRSAMNAGGITVYSGEWWHFNGPGASTARPHLNVPLN